MDPVRLTMCCACGVKLGATIVQTALMFMLYTLKFGTQVDNDSNFDMWPRETVIERETRHIGPRIWTTNPIMICD